MQTVSLVGRSIWPFFPTQVPPDDQVPKETRETRETKETHQSVSLHSKDLGVAETTEIVNNNDFQKLLLTEIKCHFSH